MTRNTHSHQQAFLQKLGQRFASRAKMVAALSKTLHLGKDAIYRRLRGETALTADELILLSTTYRLRVEPGSSVPRMSYPTGQSSIKCEVDYVRRLWKHSHEIVRVPNTQVDYASSELPLYYEFSSPTLRSFKLFMYGITTWDLPKFRGQSFDPQLIDPAVHEYAERLVGAADRLAGRELWSIGVLDVTLRQIAYVHQVGRFASSAIRDQLFRELYALVDHLAAMALSGRRFRLGGRPDAECPEFRVYHNELSSTSNAVIIKTGSGSGYLFKTLVAPSYVITDDDRIVRDVQQWFDRLVSLGTRLSVDSAKYTSHYFDRLKQQIRTYERRTQPEEPLF